jgi:hypothetical protein
MLGDDDMSENKDKLTGPADEGLKNKLERNISRRNFIKNVTVAGVAIAGGATLAKRTAKVALKEDNRKRYRADELGVERVWKNKKLYIMSEEEKDDMLSTLLDSFESAKK